MLLYEFNSPSVSPQQLSELGTYIDRLFAAVGLDINFSRHFKSRLGDERNIKLISIFELQQLFKKVYRQLHKGKDLTDIGHNAEAVLKDLASNINIPFIIKWDQRNQEFDLIAKTIMRKPNFKTTNDIFTVK